MIFGPYKATVVNLHDGDTIDVDIVLCPTGKVRPGHEHDLGFGIWRTTRGTELRRQSVRLNGCNAPELATAEGKAALAYLETMLKDGDAVTLLSHGFDKYGRCLGNITLADGRDLTAAMIAANQAAPWNGEGPKPVPSAAAA